MQVNLMAILMNLIVGTLVYGSMALLYAAVVVVPIVAVLGAMRLRVATQRTTQPPTIHRRHRHGYQTH